MSLEACSEGDRLRSGSAGAGLRLRLLPIGIVLAVTLAYLPGLHGLVPLWVGGVDSPYAHGPLLVIVSLFLMWRSGSALGCTTPSPSRAALVGLAGVGVLYAAARVSEVSSLSEALWPAACWLAIVGILGLSVARRYLVPIGLLYLALPVWSPMVDRVLWPLSSSVPPLLLKLIGTPVYADGHFIHIPEGIFEVAAGCTGLNFFLAASTLGILIAHLERGSRREWLALVAIAIALALIANWIRIAMVVEAGHLTQMQHPWVRVDHRPLGWTIFAIAVVLYCLGVRRWLPPRLAALSTAAIANPQDAGRPGSPGVGAYTAALVTVLIGPVWAAAAAAHERSLAIHPPILLPERVALLGRRHDAPASSWKPQFIGAAEEVWATYGEGPQRLLAYANSYGHERPDAKLIYYANRIYGENWSVSEIVKRPVGADMEARDGSGGKWLLRYSYIAAGQFTASPIRVKLLSALATLAFRTNFRGVVASAAPCGISCDTALAATEAFWLALIQPVGIGQTAASDKDESRP